MGGPDTVIAFVICLQDRLIAAGNGVQLLLTQVFQ